jgi:hypothetical protein
MTTEKVDHSCPNVIERYGRTYNIVEDFVVAIDEDQTREVLKLYTERYGEHSASCLHGNVDQLRLHPPFSDLIVGRLMQIIPKMMPLEKQMEILEQVRERARNRNNRLSGGWHIDTVGQLEQILWNMLDGVLGEQDHDWVGDLYELREWLESDTTHALMCLAQQFERERALALCADMNEHLLILFSAVRRALKPGTTVTTASRFNLPGATVILRFTTQYWELKMTEIIKSDVAFLTEMRNKIMADRFPEGHTTFVEYVMRTMTPDERARMRDIALNAGISLDKMMHEMVIKSSAAKADIDEIIRSAERLKGVSHRGKICSSHSTASGTTNVVILTASPAAVRAAMGPVSDRRCFVATACYEDCDHPDVMVLRRFRDRALLVSPGGRAFVKAYYKIGRKMADWMKPLPGLRRAIRTMVLEPIANHLRNQDMVPAMA